MTTELSASDRRHTTFTPCWCEHTTTEHDFAIGAAVLADARARVEALPIERIEADGPIGDHDLSVLGQDWETVEVIGRAAVLEALKPPR